LKVGSKRLNQVIWESNLIASHKPLFNDRLEDHKENIPEWQENFPFGPDFLEGRGQSCMQKFLEVDAVMNMERVGFIEQFCGEAFPNNKDDHLICLAGGGAGSVTLQDRVKDRRAYLGGEQTCVITMEGLLHRQVIVGALSLCH
jgi:hypothetical protein